MKLLKRSSPARIATNELMSDPLWKVRLSAAKRESKEGKGISLEAYLKKRSKVLPRQKAA